MAVFGDLNEANIIGNITQDIEVKHTPNGNSVTNFSVATNRNYKVNDEWKEETAFHNIVVWGNDAEYLSQKAGKGTKVFINGRLQTRSWEGQDGKKNYRTEIIANRVILLDRYERGNSQDSSVPKLKKSADVPVSDQSDEFSNSIDPNDLPF